MEYRLELVSIQHIKQISGINLGASQNAVVKARDFASGRGYCRPIVLSDSQGCMTLLSGAATYKACLEDKAGKLPAVIVQTEGEADNLMFALQSAELDKPLDAVNVGATIVKLVDSHGVTRKYIAETLDRSPAWVNRMESLSRRLNATVQKMVVEGQITSRSAQEIARLPDDVQVSFAVSCANEFLSKENVAYLTNRFLDQDTSAEERDRIIRTPKLALPNESKRRGRVGRDKSDSARLTRAIARCMDDTSHLSQLLDRVNPCEVAVRMSDIEALDRGLTALSRQLLAVFYPGKNGGGI